MQESSKNVHTDDLQQVEIPTDEAQLVSTDLHQKADTH